MKKSLLAILALSGIVSAAPLTMSLLTSDGDNYGAWTGSGTVDKVAGTYVPAATWEGCIATYTLNESILLSKPQDTLSFSYEFVNSASGNCALTVSLVGENKVLGTGKGVEGWYQGAQALYFDLGENKTGFVFANLGVDENVQEITAASTDNITGATPKSATATLTGTIAWDVESEQFMLTYTSDKVTTSELKVALGTTFDVSKIVITSTGTADTCASLSKLTLTVPEPTTATLSLLALCGLAARRRRK